MDVLVQFHHTPLSVAIVVVVTLFFYRLAEYFSDTKHYTKEYHKSSNEQYSYKLKHNDGKATKEELDDATANMEEAREEMDKAEYKRHSWLLGLGVLGICAAVAIKDLQPAMIGVSWGSAATIITAVVLQWSKYKEAHRLAILGVALAILLGISAKLWGGDAPPHGAVASLV
jgi:hypothetical protein